MSRSRCGAQRVAGDSKEDPREERDARRAHEGEVERSDERRGCYQLPRAHGRAREGSAGTRDRVSKTVRFDPDAAPGERPQLPWPRRPGDGAAHAKKNDERSDVHTGEGVPVTVTVEPLPL